MLSLLGLQAYQIPLERQILQTRDNVAGLNLGTGRHRIAALREVASTIPEGGRDAAMRTLLGNLRIAFVDAPAALSRDIDTWDDLTAAGGSAASEPEEEP